MACHVMSIRRIANIEPKEEMTRKPTSFQFKLTRIIFDYLSGVINIEYEKV